MINWIQIFSLLIMARILLPVFSYCPFRLPYLYCFICPMRCVWYQARGWLLLAIIGLNLKNDFFCQHLCPFGIAQQLLGKVPLKKLTLPTGVSNLKYLSLILLVLIIIATKMPQTLGLNFWLSLRHPLWIIFIFSILLSIFNYRFFCFRLCPIKAISRITSQFKLK